jgi:hypothetical protein
MNLPFAPINSSSKMYSNTTLSLTFTSPWWSHSFRHKLIRVSLFLACQTGYRYANLSSPHCTVAALPIRPRYSPQNFIPRCSQFVFFFNTEDPKYRSRIKQIICILDLQIFGADGNTAL